jgi:hypothetical protein
MGCFNQTAFLSNLPITSGQDTVLIFLLPKATGHAVYSTDNFTPLLLPVYGEYDEYGKIENVVRDFNVECIERYFGMPIDDLIEYVDDRMVGRHRPEEEDQALASATPFDETAAENLREVVFTLEYKFYWDALRTHYKFMWLTEGDVTQYLLEDVFGLVRDNKPSGDSRYKHLYAIPGTEEYVLHSDGRWAHFVDRNGKQGAHYTYNPRDMAKALTAVTGQDYNAMLDSRRDLTLYDFMYDLTLLASRDAPKEPRMKLGPVTAESLQAIFGEEKVDEKFLKMMQKSMRRISSNLAGEYKKERLLVDTGSSNSGIEDILGIYTELGALLDPRLKDALLAFLNTNVALGHNSITYQLASYGSQTYNLPFHLAMAEEAAAYLKTRIAEDEAEREDDEDDV